MAESVWGWHIGADFLEFDAAVVEGTWILQSSLPTMDRTFAGIPAVWSEFPWELPPYLIQATDGAAAPALFLRLLMGVGT